VKDCQSTYRAVGFMFNLQNQSTDFVFQVGDFSTEIKGNIVGTKYIFEEIKTMAEEWCKSQPALMTIRMSF
jgi:hypothetical protein